MSSFSENSPRISRKGSLIIAVPILILIIIVLLWSTFGQGQASQLMPALPEPTVFRQMENPSQTTVSFSQLNDDPIAYLNQTIVVTGNFLPVEKDNCLRYTGPDVRWSLTAENLQLDVIGFERIIKLVPIGTTMTVEGIWRLYQGPLGCGKGPPDGSTWYLEAKKILQPNPLIGKSGQPIITIEGGDQGLPGLLPTAAVDEIIPSATSVLESTTAVATEVISPTIDGQGTLAATPTPEGGVTPTVSDQQTITPLPPTLTSDPGATATVLTVTAVPTNDPNIPTATITPEQPPVPPTSTEVPDDGYPGDVETLTPTPTLDPYP